MWYYYAHCFCECFTAHAPQNQHEEDTKHNFYVRSCSPGAKRQLDPGQYGVMVAVDITKGVRKQILNYVTKGSLLAGYLEFYFAKQRGGLDPLSLNVQEKGTPPSPPLEGNSRHMPGESLHAAAPSQCLVIITIIIINIIIILLLIAIIFRLEIRIFRPPFSKYPTVR